MVRSRIAYSGLMLGVALFAVVIAWQGFHDVTEAFNRAGWGIVAIVLLHIPPLWADARGWRSLIPGRYRPPLRTMIFLRWIGESINDLLPVLQMGGNVVKAALLGQRGVPVSRAGASVALDVTLIVGTQLLFTLFGVGLFALTIGEKKAVPFILTGLGIMAVLLAGFYAAQRRGLFSFVVRISKKLFSSPEWISVSNGAESIDDEVKKLYNEHRTLAVSGFWHMLAWVLGIGEIWLALRLLGHPVDIVTALLFESLGQAIRTGAFAVPGALGIQEGGYILVGGILGIEPGIALALSLARRVRELLFGLPGIAVWHASYVSRALQRADLSVTAALPSGRNGEEDRSNRTFAGSERTWNVKRSPAVHIINAGGRLLGKWGRANLHDQDLFETASRQIGLDDFGDHSFRKPFKILLDSLEDESRLNVTGRLAVRYDLIRLLVNRLRTEQDRKQNPEIEEVGIRRPIIITGLPRTGTTFLHNLMALDADNRVLLTWEAMYPSPPPEAATYFSDRRIRLADKQIGWFHRMVKGFEKIHPVDACLPEECLVLFSQSFLSYQFETTYRLPSYLNWLEGQDLGPAYKEHRRFLQQLQWHCPKQRWVLKAPAHMFDFEALFATYPDACIVMTHRNPIEVTASNASLTATLRSAFSDRVDPFEVGPECSRRWAGAIGRALSYRGRFSAREDRFLDLYYVDLVADPVGTVRKIYDRFDIPLPGGQEKRIHEFLNLNPQDLFGKHHYSLEEFGLNAEEENKRYAAYCERFGL